MTFVPHTNTHVPTGTGGRFVKKAHIKVNFCILAFSSCSSSCSSSSSCFFPSALRVKSFSPFFLVYHSLFFVFIQNSAFDLLNPTPFCLFAAIHFAVSESARESSIKVQNKKKKEKKKKEREMKK